MSRPRVALIGTGGYGREHLSRAVNLHKGGRIRLVAVGDPHPPPPASVPEGTRRHLDGLSLLASEDIDVVIISTPIHTHFDLAAAAVRAGADVLLEKPTTATLAEYDELATLASMHAARVQVGFQSLGCTAIDAVRRRVAAGEIGEVVRYAATGAWVRGESYWERARWAGKRMLDGVVVADGVLTNPLSHATVTALALSGWTGRDDLRGVELDLHRANRIESDDTSVALLRLADDRVLTTAVTLGATTQREPYVEVVGDRGALRLFYKTGVVESLDASRSVTGRETHGFVDLFEDLLSARASGGPLCAPLEQTGAFMRLVDAVMCAPPPHAIREQHLERRRDGAGARLVVREVESAINAALRSQKTFTALGVPFAG